MLELDDFLENVLKTIIWTTKETYEILKEWGSDVVALYMFYYYTAKWQKTNKPRATLSFAAKWTKMSEERTRKAKAYLIEKWLIEEKQETPKKGQKWFWKMYIHLKYVIKQGTLQAYGFTDSCELDSWNPDTNALRKEIEMLKEKNKILEQQVAQLSWPTTIWTSLSLEQKEKAWTEWWEQYPKKKGKAKAKKLYMKLVDKIGVVPLYSSVTNMIREYDSLKAKWEFCPQYPQWDIRLNKWRYEDEYENQFISPEYEWDYLKKNWTKEQKQEFQKRYWELFEEIYNNWIQMSMEWKFK